MTVNEHFDVLIIGAGASGLKAAKELRKTGKTICVLEARNRIGGRIKHGTIAKHPIDVGAGWINNEQTIILQEAKDLGLKIKRQYAQGNSTLDLNHSLSYFNSEQFGLSFLANLSLNKAIHKLEHDALMVPIDAPWTSEHAHTWDSQTLQNWISQNIKNSQARAYFETSVTIELSIEPSKLSYLYFLQLVHADQMMETEPAGAEGAWSYSVEGGLYQIFSSMADSLKDCIHLNQAVIAIEQDGKGVTAHTKDRHYTAKYCIIAIPPTLTSHIHFTPSFSAKRSMLIQSMPMGAALKAVIAYPKPFWRKKDHSGIIITNTEPFIITLDSSPEDQSVGLLTAMSCGDHAVNLSELTKEEREHVLVKQLVNYYGDEAENPIDYIDNDWTTEPWSQCGYSGYLPPGMLTTVKGVLSFPSGRIHWAGTETATQWHGAVEGALTSGIRAANEVIERFNNQKG